MPHRYVSESTIKRLEDEISNSRVFSNRIRTIAEQGREGYAALAQQIEDFMLTARDKKNNALDSMEKDNTGNYLPPDLQQKIAYLCRGQEKAFEIMLDMLKNPKRSLEYYEEEEKFLQDRIDRLKKHELRDGNAA